MYSAGNVGIRSACNTTPHKHTIQTQKRHTQHRHDISIAQSIERRQLHRRPWAHTRNHIVKIQMVRSSGHNSTKHTAKTHHEHNTARLRTVILADAGSTTPANLYNVKKKPNPPNHISTALPRGRKGASKSMEGSGATGSVHTNSNSSGSCRNSPQNKLYKS